MVMAPNSMRAALYARVSTEHQAKAHTIDSQTDSLKQRIAQDGLGLDPELVFVDDGYSGEALERPALERLRDQVAAGAVDRVYVLSPDRLARKYAYQVLLVEELNRAGTEVVFLNHPVDPTPEGELLLQVQGIIAEYERAKILERSRRGKRSRARAGAVSVFSQAPYGFRYISKQNGEGLARFEIDPAEAEVVRQIFEWFARDRLPIREICRRLKARGLRTRQGKERWCTSLIWGILGNTAYCGRAYYGRRKVGERRPRQNAFWAAGIPVKGGPAYRHPTPAEDWIEIPVPALVEEALVEAARAQLEENRKRSRVGPDGPRHLLQGLVVCRQCGRALVYQRCHSGRLVGPPGSQRRTCYSYYRCTGLNTHYYGGPRVCSSRAVRAEHLEQSVWDDVRSLIADPERLAREYRRRLKESDTDRHRSSCRVRQLLDGVRRGISRLIDVYQEGLLDKAEFEPRLTRARERQLGLEKELAAALEQEHDKDHVSTVLGEFCTFAKAVEASLKDADLQSRIRILRLLIKQVEVGEEEICVVYKVGSCPFEQGPVTGHFQNRSRRQPVTVKIEDLDTISASVEEEEQMAA
jgi:site-specific DNA recombinase